MSITILFIGFWFFILYYFVFSINKSKDFFNPIKVISFLYLLRNVPYIILTALNEDYFNSRVLRYLNFFGKVSLDDAFLKYSFIQTIAFIFLLLGLKFIKTPKVNPYSFNSSFNYRAMKFCVNICFCIGLLGFISFVVDIGGINFLINSLSERVTLQSGQFSIKLRPLMGISTFFSILLIKMGGYRKSDKIRFIVFLITSIVVFSSTGGRKDTLYLIIMSMGAHYYYTKRINAKAISKIKIILISSFVVFYVFIIPIFRSTDGFENIVEGKANLIEVFKIEDFFSSLSYTYIDVFTVNHFNIDNIWGFSSLLTIPSNLLDRKEASLRPPIDEGMYFVSSIVWGGEYKPLIARKYLREFSFPIENMGFGYANALLPGVVLFFFLQGLIISLIYRKFVLSNLDPFWLYIYLFSIFNFNFSSLRLMNLITITFLLIVFFLIYKFSKSFSK